MNFFQQMYPLSSALNLKVIDAGPGFDSQDVMKALGTTRYSALMGKVKSVFCCNHAKYPPSHVLAGREVHCIYASDLEAFLKAGG